MGLQWFRSFTIVLCFLQLCAAEVRAADKIDLYFLTLPGLLEPDGFSGPIGEVLTEASSRAGVEFVRHFVPMNRLIRQLKAGIPAAGVPQLGAMVPERFNEKMRISPPIVFRHDYAFVRAGTPIPRTTEEMRKMVIVVSPTTVLPPPVAKLEGLSILETHSDVSAISLLSRGRADLWISDGTTSLDAIGKSETTNVTFDAGRPFFTWPAHIVYSAEVDQRIVDRIDKAIMGMADDGVLASLLPRNFVDNYNSYLLPGQQYLNAHD